MNECLQALCGRLVESYGDTTIVIRKFV
jgi:hypothetical protein